MSKCVTWGCPHDAGYLDENEEDICGCCYDSEQEPWSNDYVGQPIKASPICFFIEGMPVPQGSKTIGRHGSKVWLRDANADKLTKWRSLVSAQSPVLNLDEPLNVRLNFLLPKPKTVKRELPSVKPDIDKLVRAVLDGLTGKLFIDDSRIVGLEAYKKYAIQASGVNVTVWRYV